MQEVAQGLTEDAIPFFQRGQLLHIFVQFSQEARDAHIGVTRALSHRPCALLMVSVTYPACWVLRAMADSSSGRLVMASR